MKLAEYVGQKMVIGIPGTRITPEIVRHFQELQAGGLILYRINFDSPAQLKKLITDLEEALGRQLLVTADHEGGRVIMFREGITVFPDNLAVGTAGNLDYARQQGEIEAKELRRLGVDVNLGPVLDVLTEAYSPNIGIRSYGQDWRLVAADGRGAHGRHATGRSVSLRQAFSRQGSCPRGCPSGAAGHPIHLARDGCGASAAFHAAIRAGVDLVMSSHPYYPNLDPDPKKIATFSRRIIYDYLRQELNFQGVIASDDLEMGAIKAICPIGEAGVLAAQAGHDLLLVCHDLKAQKEVYYKLLEAYRSRQLPVARIGGERGADQAIEIKAGNRDLRRETPGPNRPAPAWPPQSAANRSRFSRMSAHYCRCRARTAKKSASSFPNFPLSMPRS